MSTHVESLGGDFTERVSRGVAFWKNFGALDSRPLFSQSSRHSRLQVKVRFGSLITIIRQCVRR